MEPQSIAFYLLFVLAAAFGAVAVYARYATPSTQARKRASDANRAIMGQAGRDPLKDLPMSDPMPERRSMSAIKVRGSTPPIAPRRRRNEA